MSGHFLALLFACIWSLWSVHAWADDLFRGDWLNIDEATSGIVRIEIRAEHDHFRIRVWGQCTPQPCAWGAVVPQAYVDHTTWQTSALMATYGKREDILTTLLLRRVGHQLLAESFTLFADERPPYWAAAHFQRKEPRVSAPVPAIPR